MNCYFSSLLGFALLGGSIATLSVTEQQHNLLRNVFSDELDKKYEKIIIERRNHFIIGLILGLIISFVVVKYVNIVNNFHRITFFLAITLGTSVVFYMIMPKSDYMLNYLKTPEENKKWLEVYITMKVRYFGGFILGILASIPFAYVLCK